jgi:hypothetical protein
VKVWVRQPAVDMPGLEVYALLGEALPELRRLAETELAG